MKTIKTLSWLVVVLGVWEFIASFILGYSAKAGALWNPIILGIVFVVLAGWAALTKQPTTAKVLSWINTVLGVWLILSPFIIGYSKLAGPLWNDIVVGIVVAVLSVWAANTKTA